MQRTIFTLTVIIALTACSRSGEQYVCWDQRAERDLDATARVHFLTGEVESFEATDTNGLRITINSDNSRFYDCISRSEIEAQRVKRQQKLDDECPAIMAKSDLPGLSPESMSLVYDKAECEQHFETKEAS